jgi:AsmA protein
MAKIFKVTGIFLSLILLTVLLAVGALITLVSPNKLKPMITTQVIKITGRTLNIDGDLSWTFYPTLAVKMNHVTLSNPAGFGEKNFAEIDNATIGVKLMPLLHSSIEFTDVTLNGLKLNLVKNADGISNWHDLAGTKEAKVSASETVKSADKKSAFAFQIPAVDVSNATVVWNDLQTKQYIKITQFEFHAKDVSLQQTFPISSTFNYAAKNPQASGQVSIGAQINADPAAEIYTLKDLDFSLKTRQNNKDITMSVTGDLTANLAEQTVAVTKWESRVANLVLTGKVDVTDLNANPKVTGHLEAPAFDLKALLQALGQDSGALQSAKNVSANFDFSTNSKSVSGIQAIKIVGKIKIPELQAAKLKTTDVNVNATLQDGILDLSSITASLYQGTLKSNAKVNLTTTMPQISFQSTLANVQAEPLLTDLDSQGSKLKVKGAGNIEIQATTSGLTADALASNLNGKSTFSFQNGVLDGINIGYLIDSANAFLKGQAAPAQGQNLTNFGNLTGTAQIKNGVVTNNDLTMISPRFDTKGQGTINLVSQQISYGLQVKPKVSGDTGGSININDLTLPVSISGNMNNPSVKLDVGALAQYVAKQKIQQVQDKVTSKIADQIKNKVPGQAGALLQNLLGK